MLGTRSFMKPSRRPKPMRRRLQTGDNYGNGDANGCNLRINTFYGAPIGAENWAIKHIKLRSQSVAFGRSQRKLMMQKKPGSAAS